MELFKLAGTILIEVQKALDSLKEVSDEATKTGESAEEMGKDFKKSGELTEDSLKEIAKESGKTTDEVKKEAEKLAKKYEEAGDDSETAMRKAFADMKKSSKNSTTSIIADFTKISGAIGAVVTGITTAFEAMSSLAESTREYRVEMAKLETAFSMAGFSADSATDTYRTLFSVLGEADQAVEAANMLARFSDTEEQLAEMTKVCIGAYATFGNSLPVEGLAEAANETAKTGTVTGQLADALNWVGLSEDDFNEKLSKCNTERERAALITATMVEAYGDAADAYLKNNEAITEAYLAEERLSAATARFGAECEEAATGWTNFKAGFLEGAADFLDGKLVPRMMGTEHIAEQYSDLEDINGKLEELQSKLKALKEMSPASRGMGWVAKKDDIEYQIAELEKKSAELTAEIQRAEDEAAAANAEYVAGVASMTNEYVTSAQAMFEQFASVYEGIYSRVSGWFAPFAEASTSVTTNINEMMDAMQSQIDFNNQYADNLQMLKDYGLGALAEEFQAYGANGSAYAQAVVDAVEKAGGATSEQGQEIIKNFAEMNAQVEESQGELAKTMALMNGEFEAELGTMVDSFGVAIDGLDKTAEAKAAASNTFEGFLQGMNSKTPGILETMREFGQQIVDSLSIGMNGASFTITPITDPNLIPKHETGLNYVPYDNYLAYLHHGEAVLNAEEAAAWRAGKKSASGGDSGSGGGLVVNQYIEAVPQTPVDLANATAAYFEQARWVT